MTDDDLVDVLRFAVLFLRSDDALLQRLGYRVLLQYAQVTGDYEPIHDIARVKDLMPVVVAAERLQSTLSSTDSFHDLLHVAHRTNFRVAGAGDDETYRTRGQMELRQFNSRAQRAVVVAPTSYGKSEMLIDRVAASLGERICVIVPTRALIAQTRANLMSDSRVYDSRVRILTHPDSYAGDASFVAVMTQERLQRLFVEQSDLALDALLIDEAHSVLQADGRAIDLAQVTLVAQHRNPGLRIAYYTPFVADPTLLRLVGDELELPTKVTNEHVKAEKYLWARVGETALLYDQFLNRFIETRREIPADPIDAIFVLAGRRTLLYVNKPSQAQKLAAEIAARLPELDLSEQAQRAIAAIGDLIDPAYSLIDAIKKGVFYHHGRVPDILRHYIERLFREDASVDPRYMVCTSTLLEGVNTPADRLIMLSHKRGRNTLSRSAFRNLAGRVGRFSEVFDPRRETLDLLQPEIALLPNAAYSDSRWNVENYLPQVADLQKAVVDKADNPLLAAAEDSLARAEALEYLENIEPGITQMLAPRSAQTEVGRLCFVHGVRDFDIFDNEHTIQSLVDEYRSRQVVLSDMAAVVDAVTDLFIERIDPESRTKANLRRLADNESARAFYSAFLSWRTQNAPYKVLISRFMGWWEQNDEEYVYVGTSWGEERLGGPLPLYVRMREKSHTERLNLAVAKVKEEHDFVDFNLMRYVDILSALDLLSERLHLNVKYGTTDPYLIALLRTGFSPELARLIEADYRDHVAVDLIADLVVVADSLATSMERDGANDVLIYEARTLAGGPGQASE
ncbi:DEAD/DEAH box helicase [Microbacterium sp. W1N]|uniref:DEAD/DEAH box helicase n=1 Tax=Microbacterium festucae TaxID=2977531 RepID=UPI0021BF1D93|nr:DEAD/DEAH box helicase [Microbacterium festucae]MCT9821127.1 DEAD/DEAH box helicase [Microbacterium festucae]